MYGDRNAIRVMGMWRTWSTCSAEIEDKTDPITISALFDSQHARARSLHLMLSLLSSLVSPSTHVNPPLISALSLLCRYVDRVRDALPRLAFLDANKLGPSKAEGQLDTVMNPLIGKF